MVLIQLRYRQLLNRLTLPGHNDPFLVTHILTLGMRTIQGGRSQAKGWTE